MAFLTCLSVPSFEIGLIPIPQASSNLIFFTPISLVKNSINFEASSELASNSIPAYISSEFSLKTIMSVVSGITTGLGTPSKYLIGL